MNPILALNMDDAKAWTFLIVGSVAAIAAAIGSLVTAIQNARAKVMAEKSEVKIDATLKNTNGNVHKLRREVAAYREENRLLKTQNTNLKQDVAAKQGKVKPRPSPKTR